MLHDQQEPEDCCRHHHPLPHAGAAHRIWRGAAVAHLETDAGADQHLDTHPARFLRHHARRSAGGRLQVRSQQFRLAAPELLRRRDGGRLAARAVGQRPRVLAGPRRQLERRRADPQRGRLQGRDRARLGEHAAAPPPLPAHLEEICPLCRAPPADGLVDSRERAPRRPLCQSDPRFQQFVVRPESVEHTNPQVPQLRVWARRHQHLAEWLDERTETDACSIVGKGTARERRFGVLGLWGSGALVDIWGNVT
jgi:hypothetical protein